VTGIKNTEPVNPHKMTAVQLVTGYHGFGINTFYSVIRNFPGVYENFILSRLLSWIPGHSRVQPNWRHFQNQRKKSLEKYVDLAREMGFAADYRMDIGTDVVDMAVLVCQNLASEFPNSTFFTGR